MERDGTLSLNDVRLWDPEIFATGLPHDVFAVLRAEAPVFHQDEPDGPGFWAITRHDDVQQLSRDAHRLSNRWGSMMQDIPDEEFERSGDLLINMDPPRHTQVRKVVNRVFTPASVRAIEPAIRAIAVASIERVAAGGRCEFVADVAAELPLLVTCELLGVPESDRGHVLETTNRIVSFQDPEFAHADPGDAANFGAMAELPEQMIAAGHELQRYGTELAAMRRRTPGDDVLSMLTRAEVDGVRLDDTDIGILFWLLLPAGTETTRGAIASSALSLIQHPDQRKLLIDSPELIPAAVDELLRFTSPVVYFRRQAVADVEVRGTHIAAGEKVLLYFASANFDDDVFADPLRLDVTRQPNPHHVFGGGGHHFCLGANLARMEMQVMFEELLARLPDLELDGEPRFLRSTFLHGLTQLPVRYPRRQAS